MVAHPAPALGRVLLIGVNGQLGRALRERFADVELLTPTRTELDVERPEAAAAVEALQPTLVLNAAAFHQVDRCEAEPERAFAANALAVDRLAETCARLGALLVTLSTDYVFDGEKDAPYDETDATAPLNVYGASKVAGESLARRHGARHLIVRTSGLFGGEVSAMKGPTFIERILRQAEAGEPLRVIDDVVFSPSLASDVAATIRTLVERDATGTYHVTNAGYCSWHAFAVAGLRAAGIARQVEAVPSRTFPSRVRRPRFSALGHAGLARLGLTMPTWQEALEAYVETRRLRV